MEQREWPDGQPQEEKEQEEGGGDNVDDYEILLLCSEEEATAEGKSATPSCKRSLRHRATCWPCASTRPIRGGNKITDAARSKLRRTNGDSQDFGSDADKWIRDSAKGYRAE